MNTHTINILERNNKKVNDGVGSVARRVENTDKRWLLCPVFPTLIRLLCKHTTQKFFSLLGVPCFRLSSSRRNFYVSFFCVHEGTITSGIRVWDEELISCHSMSLNISFRRGMFLISSVSIYLEMRWLLLTTVKKAEIGRISFNIRMIL